MPRLNLIIFGKRLCQDFTWVILLTTKELTLRISFAAARSLHLQRFMRTTETEPIKPSDDNQYAGSETRHELTWQEHKKKKKIFAAWAFSGTQWSVTAVIWYLSYQRTKEVRYMSACTNTHLPVRVCVYFGLCMTDALLIKLMDSVRTLLCLLSPLSLFSLSLSLLPAPCH